MDPLAINDDRRACSASPAPGWKSNRIMRHCLSLSHTRANLAKPRSAAALAFYHLVALLQQALALAILALLLLLDVGAFFIGHDLLPAMIQCTPTKAAFSSISKANSKRGPAGSPGARSY